MDKIAIETFAIWARRKIIADVMERASLLGITAGILDPYPSPLQTYIYLTSVALTILSSR